MCLRLYRCYYFFYKLLRLAAVVSISSSGAFFFSPSIRFARVQIVSVKRIGFRRAHAVSPPCHPRPANSGRIHD